MKSKFILQLLLSFILLNCLSNLAQAQWTLTQKIETKGDLNAVYFADSKRGWVAGDNGYLATTVDGGNSWTRQTVGTTSSISDIYFRGTDKGYLLAGNRVFSSIDGGQNWREEKILQAETFGKAQPELYSIRFASKKNGWIVGAINQNDSVVGSLVLHTVDGGSVWRKVRMDTSEELIHLDFVNENNGWIVGANGTIFVTTDGGENWRKQQSGTRTTLYHVDFKNESNGWIVGEKGLILMTTDGGAAWQKINPNVNKTLLSVEFINDKNGWIIGRDGTALRSDDGGRTWIKQDSQTIDNLFGLYFDKKVGWAVGGKGVILRYQR
ncbi:MAG: YCF48-related protein [Pyrinomonadaceae bacterium]